MPLSNASPSVILIRLMVGGVSLSEGVQKFLFPELVGVGRFEKIGLPAPEVLAPVVGSTEVVCGLLVLLGLWTRWAALPLIGIMSVALATTKLPILLESGFFAMAHAARTDYALLLGSLFLVWVGGGPWSLDALRETSLTQGDDRSP